MKKYTPHSLFLAIFILSFRIVSAQVIFQENFNNNCATGCLASGFSTWTVTKGSTHQSQANVWYVSSSEKGGIPAGSCGQVGPGDGTLHIANVNSSPLAPLACPAGDCRASYDGGYTISGVPQGDVTTDIRAITPTINLGGFNGSMTVSFLYMEGGNGITDNFNLDYSADNGATWSLLSDPAKTANGSCGAGIGKWTAYSISLPSSAKNNPNIRLGFHWVNNNDPLNDIDPSVAIDNIVICQQLVSANFSVSNASPCVNTCVDFTDLSNSACSNITVWSWTFPGGTPASFIGQNPPQICYNTPGSYTVQLYVQDDNGSSNTKSLTGFINVQSCNFPNVTFNSSQTNICESDCINFTDLTSGGTKPYTYQWDFVGGNPATSTSASPNVCYPSAGNYAVQLTVTDALGNTSSKSVSSYITVANCNAVPVIDFNANATTICSGQCVQFTDISTNNPTNWNWTISPATGVTPSISTSQNPNICFSTPGSYDVTLQASNAIGAGTPQVKTAYITVNSCPPSQNPHAAFWVSRNFICVNDCIHFTDLSTNNPTSWSWTFDGAVPHSSSVQYPTGICYSSPGIYDVELIVSNSNGKDTSHITAYIVVGFCNGVNDINDEATLVVYPNPFNKDFIIAAEDNFQKGRISIYDIMGREVKNFDLPNEKTFRVNVPELTAGIYSLNIIYSNGESVQKRLIKSE